MTFDWSFVQRYAPFFVNGTLMTLFISVFGILLAIAVGLPQAVSTAIPGVVANVIFLFKESSVVSAIALADVMYMAKDLIGMYYSTYESLFMLVVAYLVILLPISIFGTWLERRFDYERR